MRRIKRLLFQLVTGTISPLFITTAVAAMCCGFLPAFPSRKVAPADNTKTLVVYEDGVQHLVVQPEFVGSLEDFGLLMPAPSQPTVSDAPKDLFTRLEDFTNPKRIIDNDFSAGINLAEGASADSNAVRVIERKDVGQYTATILSASNGDKLREWLDENGYVSDDIRDSIIDYYVESGGFFVALKVNMEEIAGSATSTLDPIDISYKTEQPRLPTRILAANPGILSYVVYVLAPQPYVVPGSDVQYSKQLGLGDILDSNARVLLGYNPLGQWLVRNEFSIDPEKAEEDLLLTRIADAGSSNVIIDNPREIVNPAQHEPKTGVVVNCTVQGKFYLTDEHKEYLEKYGDLTNTEVFNIPYTERTNYYSYAWLNRETIYDDEKGTYYLRDEVKNVSPNECKSADISDTYSFDLGIGDTNRKGGFPILLAAQLAAGAVLVLFFLWRMMLVQKRGLKYLVPNPWRGAKAIYHWFDHHTNHRLSRLRELKPFTMGMQNAVVGSILVLIFWWAGTYYADQSGFGGSDFLGATMLILTWFMLVVVVAWGIYSLFVRPTIIGVKLGHMDVSKYFGGILVIVPWVVLIAWLWSNIE